MTFSKAAQLLRHSLELCEQVLDAETDPESIASLNFVCEQLEAAISLLEQHGDGPAIPLNEYWCVRRISVRDLARAPALQKSTLRLQWQLSTQALPYWIRLPSR